MVDTWATVGSCAQIGANVHLAGGVGIGGVLEPANAVPVVIEDDAFIGSRCMIVEGARVGRGAVVGGGDHSESARFPSSTPKPAKKCRGATCRTTAWRCRRIARREFTGGEFYLPCVLIIRRLSEGERHNKVALNDILARPRRRDVSRLDDALRAGRHRLSKSTARRRSRLTSRRYSGGIPILEVERIGDNVVARTTRPSRDACHRRGPSRHGARRRERGGDRRRGVARRGGVRHEGLARGHGGARASMPTPRSVEVTWVFYAREEISRSESGLVEIAELRPELLEGDVAILCEPTDGVVEAGCQGTLRVSVEMTGRARTRRGPTRG